MRRTLSLLACFALVLATASVMAKEKKPEKQMDPQAMMEMYKKLATPAAPHKQLANLEGSWTTKTKEWMEPGKPPSESTGSCDMKMVLDGRYLQQECTGQMMGQPYNGIGVTGYDNYTKKYVSTWMDTMGTGIFKMEGTGTPDGTITLKGGHDDPIEGHMEHRAVWKIGDPNTHVLELWGSGKRSKDMKMVEITYTRKQ